MADLDKHIWEGWRVRDFINELEPQLEIIQSTNSWTSEKGIKTKAELKEWCKDNQPYYKKHIPGVVNYFAKKYNLK